MQQRDLVTRNIKELNVRGILEAKDIPNVRKLMILKDILQKTNDLSDTSKVVEVYDLINNSPLANAERAKRLTLFQDVRLYELFEILKNRYIQLIVSEAGKEQLESKHQIYSDEYVRSFNLSLRTLLFETHKKVLWEKFKVKDESMSISAILFSPSIWYRGGVRGDFGDLYSIYESKKQKTIQEIIEETHKGDFELETYEINMNAGLSAAFAGPPS